MNLIKLGIFRTLFLNRTPASSMCKSPPLTLNFFGDILPIQGQLPSTNIERGRDEFTQRDF